MADSHACMEHTGIPIKLEIAEAQKMLDKTYTGGVAMYTKWCNDYDKMDALGYNAPKISARLLAEYLGNNKMARIVDFCAGTGKIAEELKLLGFENIDAVDGNKDMLSIAQRKGVYKKYVCQFISPAGTPGLEEDTYDGALCAGTFYSGGLTVDTLVEFIRVVKPGGYIVVVMWSKGPEVPIGQAIKRFSDKGLAKLVEIRQTESHILDKPGEGYVIQVM